jgi:sec-independent protein translocase protein TatA
MSLSIWQILLVVVLFILLFGRGRIPALMTDLAAGIRSFKQGMSEPEPSAPASPAVATTIEANQAEPSPVVKTASQERSA